MAVPKSKRSKQMSATYRNNRLNNVLLKYNIKPKFRFNYIRNLSITNNIVGDIQCSYCNETSFKKVCLNCYTKHFKGAYIKYINKKN